MREIVPSTKIKKEELTYMEIRDHRCLKTIHSDNQKTKELEEDNIIIKCI